MSPSPSSVPLIDLVINIVVPCPLPVSRSYSHLSPLVAVPPLCRAHSAVPVLAVEHEKYHLSSHLLLSESSSEYKLQSLLLSVALDARSATFANWRARASSAGASVPSHAGSTTALHAGVTASSLGQAAASARRTITSRERRLCSPSHASGAGSGSERSLRWPIWRRPSLQHVHAYGHGLVRERRLTRAWPKPLGGDEEHESALEPARTKVHAQVTEPFSGLASAFIAPGFLAPLSPPWDRSAAPVGRALEPGSAHASARAAAAVLGEQKGARQDRRSVLDVRQVPRERQTRPCEESLRREKLAPSGSMACTSRRGRNEEVRSTLPTAAAGEERTRGAQSIAASIEGANEKLVRKVKRRSRAAAAPSRRRVGKSGRTECCAS